MQNQCFICNNANILPRNMRVNQHITEPICNTCDKNLHKFVQSGCVIHKHNSHTNTEQNCVIVYKSDALGPTGHQGSMGCAGPTGKNVTGSTGVT